MNTKYQSGLPLDLHSGLEKSVDAFGIMCLSSITNNLCNHLPKQRLLHLTESEAVSNASSGIWARDMHLVRRFCLPGYFCARRFLEVETKGESMYLTVGASCPAKRGLEWRQKLFWEESLGGGVRGLKKQHFA